MFSTDAPTRIRQLAEAIVRRLGLANRAFSSDTTLRTLQFVETVARHLGILPKLPLEPVPPMSTITKTIGTTSRDYSTITAWEADLDNVGVYASGDVAVGECYNDSAFNESVSINGGGTVGLASRTLTVAASQRHTGVAGSGARLVMSAARNVRTTITNTIIEWLEINHGGFIVFFASNGDGGTNSLTNAWRNLIIHNSGTTDSAAGRRALQLSNGSSNVTNCLIYNHTGTANATGLLLGATPVDINVLNTTVHDCDGTAFSFTDHANLDIRNCIATDNGTGFSDSTISSATINHNLSSDATASGTGSLTSKTSANQFVSTVVGSEDLHLKAGADAIDAGVDLGTTPTGVNIDINGRDRDASGDVWDIGAHELASAAIALGCYYYRMLTGDC